ncbi:MAG: nicotinate phosphoribosyltransferase [Methanomassiliicoccales archaeon]
MEIHEDSLRCQHPLTEKGEILRRFFIAAEEDIASGRTTDVYFLNTRKLIEANGLKDVSVAAEITASDLPSDWKWAVFAGLEEMLRLFDCLPVTVYAMPEGTIFRNRSRKGVPVPVARIEGKYYDFAIYETPALGFICHTSGISTMAARYRIRGMRTPMISFGIRRAHPALAPMIDRAAYIGGFDAVSSLAGAEAIGHEPQGTMPHSAVLLFNDSERAFRAYADVMGEARKIVLVDTLMDEKTEALLAARTVKDLYGVRLDTPRSRRGNFAHIISEVRWELDTHGHQDVKIFISGGIREEDVETLIKAGADGFGIGTAISGAPPVDFALDIVHCNGADYTKRGKFSGRKEVFRCPSCFEFDVLPEGSEAPVCETCGFVEETMLSKFLADGKRLIPAEKPDEIRGRVLTQIEKLSSVREGAR